MFDGRRGKDLDGLACSDSIGLAKLSYGYRSIVDVGYLTIFRCDQALSKRLKKPWRSAQA
jgi:hypothetical protein